MGWARTLLLGDIGNRLDIADNEERVAQLRQRLSRADRKDASQDAAIERLTRENDHLRLVVAALVRLLESKGIVARPELEEMAHAIDAEDGRVDGRTDAASPDPPAGREISAAPRPRRSRRRGS